MQETKLGKYSVIYSNSTEYHSLKREIWGQDIYHFESDNEEPFIVDIGAHIGISILYFKSIYPKSRILAFEPNPVTFEILKQNIFNNGLEDITVVNKAVWIQNGKKEFYIDSSEDQWHSNSSFLEKSWSGKEETKKITVETTRLDEYIDGDIDLLKMDTEGMEYPILNAHKKVLSKVKNIVLEYHPRRESKPIELVNLLDQYFEMDILSDGKILKKLINNKLLTIKGKQSM
jgi:FkbM family methyltransferase